MQPYLDQDEAVKFGHNKAKVHRTDATPRNGKKSAADAVATGF